MKKLLLMLIVTMLLMISGCEKKETLSDHEEENEMVNETLDGGWNIAENITLTKELNELFTKAMEELVGVDYEPIAYLASQIVAGTNHCFLCKATIVYPDANPYYALVYVYEDLEGNTEITNIVELDIVGLYDGSDVSLADDLLGSWQVSETNEVSQETEELLSKALDGLTGAEYEPLLDMAYQIVSGTNHCLLCKMTPVVPDSQSSYVLLYFYEDLQGNVSELKIADIDVGTLSENQ